MRQVTLDFIVVHLEKKLSIILLLVGATLNPPPKYTDVVGCNVTKCGKTRIT